MAERAAEVLLNQPVAADDFEQPAADRASIASQWRLIWWKFKSHRLALASVAVLGLLYLVVLFAPFLTPYDPLKRDSKNIYVPPQRLRFVDESGFNLRPFVYKYTQKVDLETLERVATEDRS